MERTALAFPEAELVIGLVSPVGTNLKPYQTAIETSLKEFGYDLDVVRLSDRIRALRRDGLVEKELVDEPYGEYLRSYMDAGDNARKLSKRADVLALAAAHEIYKKRSGAVGAKEPRSKRAHLLWSLKRPEEVQTLRRIYGPGFFLLGASSPDEERLSFLIQKDVPKGAAQELIERDLGRESDEGQSTRSTFELADAFVPLLKNENSSQREVRRILELLFGNTFHTPTRDEHAMFMAYTSSLRSGSLSRQVGAVVVSEHGEVIATGANDVPAPGGGLYWPGTEDERDLGKEWDSNDQEIGRIATQLLKKLGHDEAEQVKIKDSQLFDVTEYGRAVHAEMDALLSCARVGSSPRNGTIYSTTFPCHNCAKHIVAAGIKRVVYVEPYPKSRAIELHSDAIVLHQRDSERDRRVLFEPFQGVGPRRFFDLFSLRLSSGERKKRKNDEGKVTKWTAADARPRVPMLPSWYVEREEAAIQDLAVAFQGVQQQKGLPFAEEAK